eukprot:3773974-Amphidinium_carterae.1
MDEGSPHASCRGSWHGYRRRSSWQYGQADLRANQGTVRTAAHGMLAPDATWTNWADFANKVYHYWGIVGPQLRLRPDSEPCVRLDRICAWCATRPSRSVSNVDARRARSQGVQLLYLKRQDCCKLTEKKVKVRPAGFLATEVRKTDPGARALHCQENRHCAPFPRFLG